MSLTIFLKDHGTFVPTSAHFSFVLKYIYGWNIFHFDYISHNSIEMNLGNKF